MDAITGLVSVGGGFPIIPLLVLFAHILIRLAVGTSLLIISTNSFIGLLGDMNINFPIDYLFLMKLCAFSIVGIIIGSNLARFIPSARLKPLFGGLILLMGLSILIRELFYSSRSNQNIYI